MESTVLNRGCIGVIWGYTGVLYMINGKEMETTVLSSGLYRGYIGLYWGYIYG